MTQPVHEVTLDFETYYDDKYSLRKDNYPIPLYIRDERFKVHGCSLKLNDEPARWLPGDRIKRFSHLLRNSRVIAHNGQFDFMILHDHYGIQVGQRACTQSMARALLPRGTPLDLGQLAKLLQVGTKGDELVLSKGLHVLPPDIEEQIASYCINDSELCYGIYTELKDFLPPQKWVHMDLILEISTEGLLEFDYTKGDELRQVIENDRISKRTACGVEDPKQLTSRDRFAELLRERGIEPPTKISPTTHKQTWAFSKGDPDFVALQVDPVAGPLVQARMAHASNNALGRVKRLCRMAQLGDGTIPIMVHMSGAHTHRLSGGGKINMQNLNARGPQGKLRQAFHAPKDHVLIVLDQSGIELRLNLWFSEQNDKLDMIRNGEDLYIDEAKRQLHKDIIEDDDRQFGKVITLGCGYGMGRDRFRVFCAAGPLGAAPIYLSDLEAFATITTYRLGAPKVVDSWNWFTYEGLSQMADTGAPPLERGCVTLGFEEIMLPGGLSLQYPDLTPTEDGWASYYNGNVKRLWGGILQENTIQSLAAELINEQMDAITALDAPGRIVLQVHDEIVYCAPEREAEDIMSAMADIMTAPVPWAPGLPLNVEGGFSYEYKKHKSYSR